MTETKGYQDPIPEELINGNRVPMDRPTWNHISSAGNLFNIFYTYLENKPATPILSGFDLHLSEKDIFLPDVMVCDWNKIRDDGVYGSPALVVEVLSPVTTMRDRGYKKDAYEAHGVPEYWVVDPMNQFIEVYLLQDGHYVLDNIYTKYPDYVLNEMTQEEKAALVTEFKCHLYDDLLISLKDVFKRLI